MSLKHRSEMEDYFRLIENKPEIIAREQQFMDNLKLFYRQKWNCILKPPIVNGKPLNLYKLYSSVIERGGWIKVCSGDKWKEIATELNFTDDTAMIDAGLKLLYTRYLSKYEEVQTIGELDEHDVDIFGKSRTRSQFVNNECPISHFYREKRRDVLESEYARIVKTLYSGFPNEVDFCFNILTLMIAPGPYTLRLEKCPLLLSLIIAHAGVFGDNVHLHELSENGWKKYRDRGFEKFWLSSGINDDDILALIPINPESSKKDKYLEDFFTFDGDYNPKNETRFRIYQAVAHLRNMSFEPTNQTIMGKSDILIQFMTVCAASKHLVFAKEAMETLANIASEIDLLTLEGDYVHCLTLKLLADHLMGDDKHRVLQSLEIIGNLCQNDRNESVCAEFISQEILSRMFNLVSVKDILLCIYTLEALYQISELGRSTCNKIATHSTAINQLISLVTTEAASFGKSGLSGIQVVESLPNQHQMRQHYPPPQQISSQQQFRQPYPPSQHQYGPPPPPTTPKYQIPRPTTRVVVQPPVAFAHDEKLKNLTAKWIKEHLVAEPGATAVRGDVYSNYVDYMKNVHSIMSGSVQMFTSILQSAFPCTIKSEQKDSTMVYLIEGVKFIKPLQQQISQVAANHPVMQKILTTPKASSIPRAPSATTSSNSNVQPTMNGVSMSKASSVEPKQENDEKEKTASRSVTPSNSISTENGSNAIEAKTLIPENEQHETKIIRVENIGMGETNGDDSTAVLQKVEKVMNGKVRPKGRPRKYTKEVNGGCNGIGNGHETESDKTVVAESETKENGDLHEPTENGIIPDELPQDISNKIDDSIEAVCKATPKNGWKSKGRKRKNPSIDEESLINGNEVVEKKKRSPAKKARLSEGENAEIISQDRTMMNGEVEINGDVQIPSTSRDYMCEWNACGHMFSSVETIMAHHLTEHVNLPDEETNVVTCLWPTCDGTKRGKWSLITHIQDHHCQEHILKQSIIKRTEMGGNQTYLARIKQQLIDRPKETMAQVPFAPTAANEAIRRHAYTNIQREIIDEQEGPVTKCIRLTAALILRNIARYSEEGRSQLRRYENQLFPLALSRLEAGATLAQCLSELQEEESISTFNSDGINEQKLYPRI